MSGSRNNKPDDIIKHRQEYIDNLNETIELSDQNEQAVRLYTETGQMPAITQMADNRTIEQKLRDFDKIKQSIIVDLSPIADNQLANSIVQSLIQSPLNIDNNLLIFLAQRAPDIVNNLKKIYKFGIKGDADDVEQFVQFVIKFYNEKNTLTQNTKSFMARVGVNLSMSISKRMEQQSTVLTRLEAELYAIYNKVYMTLRETFSPYKSDVNETLKQSKNIILSIFSIIKNLNYIYPSNPNIFDNIEKLLTNIEGNEKYDYFSNEISKYMYFINHNLPNIDFFGSLISSLNKSKSFIMNIYETTDNDQPLNIELVKFNDILKRIYDQLNTGFTMDELKKTRLTFNKIIQFINEFSILEQENLVYPKSIKEPNLTRLTDSEAMNEPSFGDNFGDIQRNYFFISEYPPNFPMDKNGFICYTWEYINPLLDVVPNKKIRSKYQKTITDLNNSDTKGEDDEIEKAMKYVKLKDEILTYLQRNKINLSKITVDKDIFNKTTNPRYDETGKKLKAPYNLRRVKDYDALTMEPTTEDVYNYGIEPSDEIRWLSDEKTDRTKTDRTKPEDYLQQYLDEEDEFERRLSRRTPKQIELQEQMDRKADDRRRYFAEQEADKERKEEERLQRRILDRKQSTVKKPISFKRRETPDEQIRRLFAGTGLRHIRGCGLVNDAIGIQQTPRYIKFGKYLINTKKLEDGKLSLRTLNGGGVSKFPVYTMSHPFRKIVKKIVGGELPSKEQMSQLSDSEKQYLKRVYNETELDKKIKIPAPSKDREDKEIHKFNTLKGEIMAGNDSKILISQFKAMLIKMKNSGYLDKQEADDVLQHLDNIEYN